MASKCGNAVRLSVDHRADAPEEEERIINAGGMIEFGRLEGELQVCRGLGDFELEPGLTPSPYIAEVPVDGLEYILMASDGIWDALSDQEAVNTVSEALLGDATLQEAAVELVELSQEKGSRDDISLVIIQFQ